MSHIKIPFLLCAGLLLSGCASTSKVQEMIDSSNRNYTDRLDSHEASIDVLKQSAVAGLEKAKQNSEMLKEVNAQLKTINEQMRVIQGYAEASKVMSAANTVKVADLDEQLKTFLEADAEMKRRMKKIDELYERVMIAHYQAVVDSANASILALKEEGWRGGTNAPVRIDQPIEIVAPDTSVVTSAQPASATVNTNSK